MSLVIFDLDNTLIGGDSDYLWGQFLVEKGVVDKHEYEEKNAEFYRDYRRGTLDIAKFLKFALNPLKMNDIESLYVWREQFIDEKIKPIILPAACELVDRHSQPSNVLLVLTATNRFVTEPIVALFGIDNMLATVPERKNGRFTGDVEGTPCFKDGKVTKLETWLSENNVSFEDSWFYSDSHNDLPLLSLVDHPVAVDPDDTLKKHATDAGWSIISLR